MIGRAVAFAAARWGTAPLGRLPARWLGATSTDLELVGAAEIDPSWLVPETTAADPQVARWLERDARAELVDMPRSRTLTSTIGDVPHVPGPVVQHALEDLGIAQMGLALQAAPESLPRVAGHLGERARDLFAAARRKATRLEVAAAVRELGDLAPGVPPVFAAGVRHAGPALAFLDDEARQQTAQRLSRVLGRVLVAEAARAAPDRGRADRFVIAISARMRRSS